MQIKCRVKRNKFGWLELFYFSEYGTITSFCFEEGHNDCCHAYFASCKPVDETTAKAFIEKYNAMYNDNINFVFSKRLQRIKANA